MIKTATIAGLLAAMLGRVNPTSAASEELRPDRRQSEAFRVRSSSPAVNWLMHEAMRRSATFRELVRALDETDGLVYVAAGHCGASAVRACLMHHVTVAGPNRILHLLVDTNRRDRDVMSAIGHELAHALEVLNEPRISDGQGVTDFYRTHGVRMKGVLETYNAIQAGASISSELGRSQ